MEMKAKEFSLWQERFERRLRLDIQKERMLSRGIS
jgi:hypothetical protein